ncbi:hypothetical protein HZC53_03540 [Candidatus Uhrbacteria bacterium]|nr:hypothetical protein [Candidatus Uhrbacteria bacterium]
MGIREEVEAVKVDERRAAVMLRAEREAQANRLSELRERIKNGETTGDPVMDYVMVQWNGDEQVVDWLKQLESALAGNIGQYILAIRTEREWHNTGHGGGFGPSGYEELRRRDISLGILSDDKLVLDLTDGSFGFRTGGKSSWVDTRHRSGLHSVDMLFEKDDFLYLPTVRQVSGGRGDLSILVGADKVFDWLEMGNGIGIDFSIGQLLSLALMIQAPDALPGQLAELHREQVKSVMEDVAKAQGVFGSNRDILFDVSQNLGHRAGEVANAMRNAIRDLMRLEKRAIELKVDPTPITEFLARHTK